MAANKRPQTTDIVKKDYEEIIWKGQLARKYLNGIIRHPNGYILEVPAEVSREMVEAKRNKRQALADEAIKRGTDSLTPEEGVIKLLTKTVKLAMENKQRPGNDAVNIALKAAGYLSDERSVEVRGTVKHTRAEFPPEYLEFLDRISRRDVIEGKVKDADA